MFGVLFPVKSTDADNKSPFIRQLKKIFHYSDGVTGTEKTKAKKTPLISDEGKPHMFKDIKGVFHYLPGGEKGKVKKYPKRFDGALEKELKYPHKGEVK
jgi:hypothetical protein